MESTNFKFSSVSHKTLDFNLPLWKVKKDYPDHWTLIIDKLSKAESGSGLLIKDEEISIWKPKADDDVMMIMDLIAARDHIQ